VRARQSGCIKRWEAIGSNALSTAGAAASGRGANGCVPGWALAEVHTHLRRLAQRLLVRVLLRLQRLPHHDLVGVHVLERRRRADALRVRRLDLAVSRGPCDTWSVSSACGQQRPHHCAALDALHTLVRSLQAILTPVSARPAGSGGQRGSHVEPRRVSHRHGLTEHATNVRLDQVAQARLGQLHRRFWSQGSIVSDAALRMLVRKGRFVTHAVWSSLVGTW
jgi:hypothetical protein